MTQKIKANFSIVFVILIYLLFCQSVITRFSFFYENRTIFTVVLVFFIIFYISKIAGKPVVLDFPLKILLFTYFILLLIFFIKQRYVNAIGAIVFIGFLFTINHHNNFENTFKQIIKLNKLLNFFSFLSVL